MTRSSNAIRPSSRAHIIGTGLDYEPDPQTNIGNLARAQGRSVNEVALEAMMANGGKSMLLLPHENYHHGNLDDIREMMLDDAAILGLADGVRTWRHL